MSDPELVDESADNTQSVETTDSSPPPWGDDFDAARAWQTISHLRKREQELESDAKAWKRFREDEDARRETLAELGYEFEEADDEDGPDEFEVDTAPVQIPKALQKELDELKAWRSQQEQREAKKAFDDHISELAAQSEVSLTQFEKQAVLAASVQAGFNPKSTEAAFKELLDYKRAEEQRIIEQYGASKKAPRFSSSGKSATNVKPIHEMTAKERQEYMLERFQTGE